jgi:DNA-binding NtrC family response regulator
VPKGVLIVTDSIRVLVVDETSEDRYQVDEAFVAAGFNVQRVDDADLALGVLAVQVPDVLVVDLRVPGAEGHRLLATLPEHPSASNVPVILVGELSNIVKPMPIVPFGLVPTPIDLEHLVASVRRVAQQGKLVSAN